MKSFILEDDIEQALLKKLKEAPFNYDVILCNPSLEVQDNPDNGPHRDSVDQCVLPTILYDSLIKLNPNISKEKIQETVKNLSKNFTDKDIVETNYKLYQMIREKIKITEKRNGKEEFDFINLIDDAKIRIKLGKMWDKQFKQNITQQQKIMYLCVSAHIWLLLQES